MNVPMSGDQQTRFWLFRFLPDDRIGSNGGNCPINLVIPVYGWPLQVKIGVQPLALWGVAVLD